MASVCISGAGILGKTVWNNSTPFLWNSQIAVASQILKSFRQITKCPNLGIDNWPLDKHFLGAWDFIRHRRASLGRRLHSLQEVDEVPCKGHRVDPGRTTLITNMTVTTSNIEHNDISVASCVHIYTCVIQQLRRYPKTILPMLSNKGRLNGVHCMQDSPLIEGWHFLCTF